LEYWSVGVKECPEIKIISVNGPGNMLGTRILSEIRTGKFVADLYSGAANTKLGLLKGQGARLSSRVRGRGNSLPCHGPIC